MFTGIIEDIGHIRSAGPLELVVSAGRTLQDTRPGDSVAVNGVCLTVTDIREGTFSFEIMPETVRRTNLGALRPGDRVNLERALLVGNRLGGHLVQGHVDSTARIISMVPEGDESIMRAADSPEITGYVVEKGFIAIDGISLTIVACGRDSFRVSLVGYTRQHTTLGLKRPGDPVNLEVDILAKYVAKLAAPGKVGEMTLEYLAEHGFA